MDMPAPTFAEFLSKPKEIGAPKSIMLYGPPGTRKTTLSAELIKRPGVNKILFIDIDNGSEALVGDPEVSAALADGRIQVLAVDSLDPNAFGQVTQVINEMSANAYGYDYVVIDTLNLSQEVAANYFLANTTNSSGKQDGLAAWAEIGKWTNAMARQLHNSPHTTGIFILHETSATDSVGKVSVVPKLSGSAKDTIASIPSIVVHLDFEEVGEAKEVKLVANLGDSNKYVTKNRYRLPSRIEDFSLVKLYEEIDRVRGIPTATQVRNAVEPTNDAN